MTLPTEELTLVRGLFGENVVFDRDISEDEKHQRVSRHKHYIFLVDGKKIILKKYQSENLGLLESGFYEFFESLGSICVPKVHYRDKFYLVTDFIEQTRKPDMKRTIVEWGNVHSKTRGNFEGIREMPFESILRHTLDKGVVLGDLFIPFVRRMEEGLVSDITAVTHGDLYSNNVLSVNDKNFYIDFEYSGRSHPSRDLGLILFNAYKHKKEIIQLYRQNIDFDYSGLERDIETNLILKLGQVIIGLNRDTNLPYEFRQKFLKKAKGILENLLL